MNKKVNKILICLEKTLDIEQFEDYNENIFEARMEDIIHIIGFVQENKQCDDKMKELEKEIANKYKNSSEYFEYLTNYEDTKSQGEFEYCEKLYKYGIKDAIKIIGKRAEEELNNLLILEINDKQLQNILNQRVENITQDIISIKQKNLEWEKTIDEKIKNEELVIKYKKLIDSSIILNRQLSYKYGIYDVICIFKLSLEN